jgi:hypothetical protein
MQLCSQILPRIHRLAREPLDDEAHSVENLYLILRVPGTKMQQEKGNVGTRNSAKTGTVWKKMCFRHLLSWTGPGRNGFTKKGRVSADWNGQSQTRKISGGAVEGKK